ncbi:HesB/IscA family protein [Brachybacterium hainanense]|uniref:HesB/IscA family protein n=1 Tax=Brachybacterium hainanense TaxID=1541174 RepID=A0ABV6R5U5_9MICO
MSTMLPPFTVTLAAISRIEELGGALLVDAEPGGCSGTAWVFTVPGDAPPGSQRYGCPGAYLHVSTAASDLLADARLDYAVRIRPPRFRVLQNPNTPLTCPCRRSFGRAWPGAGDPACRPYEPMPWDEDFVPPARWVRQTGWHRAGS